MNDSTYAAPAIRDTTVVRHFRSGTLDGFLPRLNLDLGLTLSAETFLRLQTYFKTVALRDPTVGELRILNAAEQSGQELPARIAVGELLTASPAIAETWADMMAKHGSLHGAFSVGRGSAAATPPCTLTEAMTLTGRYLHANRLCEEGETILLSTMAEEAVAAASGYAPVARMMVGDGFRALWTRSVRTEETPCKTGDMLLYLPRLKPRQACDLVAADAKNPRPTIGALRAVADSSLLSVVRDMCPAADLYVNRLAGQESTAIPADQLCALPRVGANGECGYVARVPLRHVQSVSKMLADRGIAQVVCGRVRTGGGFVFLIRDREGTKDIPAATLPADLLAAVAAPRTYTMRPEAASSPSPSAYRPAVAHFPSVFPEECGLTPDGHETVALTLHEGALLLVPEADTSMTILSVDIPDTSAGYAAAAETVAAAAQVLESGGTSPSAIRLAVSLTAASPAMLTCGAALAAVCGVYCAAAQLGLPVEDAVIETVSSDIPLRLTVTAWATNRTHGESLSPSAVDSPRHEPSESSHAPDCVFPVLRRSYEGSLKALAAALGRDRAASCSLRPLAMNQLRDEETGETRYTLHPDSERKLLDLLATPALPIFAMNGGDTRLLLSHPSVSEALRLRLERGGTVLVLGESCKPFAELGFLPAALTQIVAIPVASARATALYSFPAEPSARHIRVPLSAAAIPEAATSAPHVLTLHVSGGIAIPDGFVGGGGKVLGLLNGVDSTILSRIGQSDFSLLP